MLRDRGDGGINSKFSHSLQTFPNLLVFQDLKQTWHVCTVVVFILRGVRLKAGKCHSEFPPIFHWSSYSFLKPGDIHFDVNINRFNVIFCKHNVLLLFIADILLLFQALPRAQVVGLKISSESPDPPPAPSDRRPTRPCWRGMRRQELSNAGASDAS